MFQNGRKGQKGMKKTVWDGAERADKGRGRHG